MVKSYIVEKNEYRLIWRPGSITKAGTETPNMEVHLYRWDYRSRSWILCMKKTTSFSSAAPDKAHLETVNLLLELMLGDETQEEVERTIESLTEQNYQKLLIPSDKQVKMVCKAVIEMDPKILSRINSYLKASDPEDYQDEDHTISCTATFPNGYQMDIKCCGSQNGPSWTEAVLFDAHGSELCMSDPEEEFDGEWSLEYEGVYYEVEVVPRETLIRNPTHYLEVPFIPGTQVKLAPGNNSGLITEYVEYEDKLIVSIFVDEKQITGTIRQITFGEQPSCIIHTDDSEELEVTMDRKLTQEEVWDSILYSPCGIGTTVKIRSTGEICTVKGFRYECYHTEALVQTSDRSGWVDMTDLMNIN